ncbi:MAG: serine/threonine protein kinase [Deltaproteobacteria bacterium]|nr:serine/threonine protein kinase [Deltaproteobacteria bacterium]
MRKLGAGGMGAVYEAEHLELGKRVALKTLHKELTSTAEVVARFVREGKATARVRHPHVVDVQDVGSEAGVPFLVMEYLEGEDLASMLSREGRLSVSRAVDLLLPVLAGVDAAHQAGIVHRDLKPENIFLVRGPNGDPHPKVLDFGIAKVMDPVGNLTLTRTASLLGTPYYMSPEQARGSRDVDARTDQYALGVILFQALVRRRPHQGDSLLALIHQITTTDAPAPSTVRPDLPPELDAVVLRTLSRDASARFPSVLALGASLLPFASEAGRARWQGVFEHATVPPPEPPPEPLASNLPTLAGGLAGNVPAPILASSVGPWAVDSGERPPPSPRRKVFYVGVVAALVASVAVGGTVLVRHRQTAAQPTSQPSVSATPPTEAPPVVTRLLVPSVSAPPTPTPPAAPETLAEPASSLAPSTPVTPTAVAAAPAEPNGRRRRAPAPRRPPRTPGGASTAGGTYFIP